jgi:hypothetical protein
MGEGRTSRLIAGPWAPFASRTGARQRPEAMGPAPSSPRDLSSVSRSARLSACIARIREAHALRASLRASTGPDVELRVVSVGAIPPVVINAWQWLPGQLRRFASSFLETTKDTL